MATHGEIESPSAGRQPASLTRCLMGHKMAAGVGIEPTSYTLTACRIALMLTGNKINKMERMARVELAVPAWKAVTAHADTRSQSSQIVKQFR